MPTRSIEVKLDSPDAPSLLAQRIRRMQVPEAAKANMVIAYISRQLPVLYGITEFWKQWELVHPEQPNSFRLQHLYYQPDREKQEYEDGLFEYLLPQTYAHICEKAGTPSERWEKTVAVARRIASLPILESMNAIVHCRAKSNFSIFRKMKKKNIDPEEIFDKLGVRVVVDTTKEAYQVKEAMLSAFAILPEHRYLRPGEHRGKTDPSTHFSYRDYLSDPKENERAIRINLVDGDHVFEVKITTKDILKDYYNDPTFPAEMALFHEYRAVPRGELKIDPSQL